MFALIEMQKMELVCKFADHEELLPEHLLPPYLVVAVETTDELMALTTLELRLLYGNLGVVPGTLQGNKQFLADAVLKLIKRRVESSPKQIGVFEPYIPDPAGTGGAPAPRADSTGTRAAGLPTAPRGGTSFTVFEVADQMWAEAGKPTELPTVLALRKKMMDVLEKDHGIKRTTSSTTLGGWQKARLNN